jgi:hypothetical protein
MTGAYPDSFTGSKGERFAGKTHGAKQGSLYTSSCPDRRASGVIRASLTALARDGRIKSGHDACNNRHQQA